MFSGCVSTLSTDDLANADYGSNLDYMDCKSIAESIVASNLKDPSSAQFRNSRCFKGYVRGILTGTQFGWLQTGEVNGKNSFGGYVGFTSYQVLIRNGRVVTYCITDKNGLCLPKLGY